MGRKYIASFSVPEGIFDGSALKTLVLAPEVSIDSEIPEASSLLLFWTTIPMRIASRSSSSMSFWILVM